MTLQSVDGNTATWAMAMTMVVKEDTAEMQMEMTGTAKAELANGRLLEIAMSGPFSGISGAARGGVEVGPDRHRRERDRDVVRELGLGARVGPAGSPRISAKTRNQAPGRSIGVACEGDPRSNRGPGPRAGRAAREVASI